MPFFGINARSILSRSILLPNRSMVMRVAASSSARFLSVKAAVSWRSAACSRRKSRCVARSAAFSRTSESMRARSPSRLARENTTPSLRRRGSFPSYRYSTCRRRRGTVVSIMFIVSCFSRWNRDISSRKDASALPEALSFFASASASFFNSALRLASSFITSSWSCLRSRSARIWSHKDSSQSSGRDSSISSSLLYSSSSSESSSSLSSSSTRSPSARKSSPESFFKRLIRRRKILRRYSRRACSSFTNLSNSFRTFCLRSLTLSSSAAMSSMCAATSCDFCSMSSCSAYREDSFSRRLASPSSNFFSDTSSRLYVSFLISAAFSSPSTKDLCRRSARSASSNRAGSSRRFRTSTALSCRRRSVRAARSESVSSSNENAAEDAAAAAAASLAFGFSFVEPSPSPPNAFVSASDVIDAIGSPSIRALSSTLSSPSASSSPPPPPNPPPALAASFLAAAAAAARRAASKAASASSVASSRDSVGYSSAAGVVRKGSPTVSSARAPSGVSASPSSAVISATRAAPATVSRTTAARVSRMAKNRALKSRRAPRVDASSRSICSRFFP
mmetsp:Transcript_6938/g.28456  ORF Transcript_6938/g.28456 Transcript_6938/m.28456 type:complete len:564 (+) Transcript_6938:831-2522(+)